MTSNFHFVADAALVDRLGRELVAKQETALIELVKNAYDADATQVTVTIEPKQALTIEDNGTGMTHNELVDGFLRLASNSKVREPLSRRYRRQRAGRKGIGRFSAQRLGQLLTLRTWTDKTSLGHELSIDWTLFKPEIKLEDVPIRIIEIPPRAPGTMLRIEGLRDNWTETQMKRCWRGVLNLQQPFPIAPVSSRPKADPGFAVRFFTAEEEVVDTQVVVDLNTEILNHLHARIELHVNQSGRATWRLIQNSFGPDREWTRIHHEHRDSKDPPSYPTLNNVWMRAYYFILDRNLLPSVVYTRLRDILRAQGGIRLYRNGFRVVPYGSPGDDWLGLDETSSQRGSILAPFRNLNFFGVIEVHDPKGINFEENTSREGLIESTAFFDLQELASSVLTTAVRNIAQDRGRKPSAGGRRAEPKISSLDKIREAERRARDAIVTKELRTSPSGEVLEVAELLRESGDIIAAREAELADEATILRLLATLGLTAAEFNHETGMTFEAVQMSLRRVFEVARQTKPDDSDFQQDVDLTSSMLNRLVTLTSYLNSVASARAIRELTPVSVCKELDKFHRGIKLQANKQDIELILDIPELDPLYTTPMHEADIATILLNFYSNSVKAMRRTRKKRKILTAAKRNVKNDIVILFSDTGDGVEPANREMVFDLFFTTRVGAPSSAQHEEQITGTGLGLWIVRQVILKAGGEVRVGEAPKGFSTCFEVRLPTEEEDA